jgi:Ser/Thr protein kinase RdoA (MazF antagonist)
VQRSSPGYPPLGKPYQWRGSTAPGVNRSRRCSNAESRNLVTNFAGRLGASTSASTPYCDCCTPLPQRACSVIHGDLVPPNVLVDADERPLAIADFGFLSTVGDPAFDATMCASTFDIYGANADETREMLTRELASRLDYRIDELSVYHAAYAIATSNAYDPGGQDGDFLWCVGQLQRPDLVRVLGV